MIYAEQLPYWETSQASPDTWIERACQEIVRAGGVVKHEVYGRDQIGRAGYALHFAFKEDEFHILWPVIPSRAGNERAARRQAATMLFHDVKAKCIAARVHGPRSAFFQYFVLPDGRTAAQVSGQDLLALLPRLLPGV